jgi:deoxyribose-phosphate aldolase
MPAITVSLPQLAKTIDHSLLHPTMTDADIVAGLDICKRYSVATACIKPYLIPLAAQHLQGSDVRLCPVIGFPHGNSTTEVKVFEAQRAMEEANKAELGVVEVDMVVNVGKVLGGDWAYVEGEIREVNSVVTGLGGLVKVIFEIDYLERDDDVVRLCEICTRVGVAFVKTSTGYGFVKQENGMYSYKGATVGRLRLMRERAGKDVQVKAAGGVRTLDDLLSVMALGCTRVGATATVAMLEEAKRRGVGETPVEVEFTMMGEEGKAVGY